MGLDVSAQRAAVVVQEKGKRGIQKFTARQHDQIETRHRLVVSEELANSALRPIAPNRLSQPPRRDNSQPAERAPTCKPDERHISPPRPDSTLLDPQELRAPSDALLARQRMGRVRLIHGSKSLSGQLLPGDGQAVASLRSSPAEHPPTTWRTHPRTEPVRLLAVAAIWLKGALHLNPTPQ